jgi:hypothetical protein
VTIANRLKGGGTVTVPPDAIEAVAGASAAADGSPDVPRMAPSVAGGTMEGASARALLRKAGGGDCPTKAF